MSGLVVVKLVLLVGEKKTGNILKEDGGGGVQKINK